MAENNLIGRIKRYGNYLNQELTDLTKEKEIDVAIEVRLMMDKYYEVFPEAKPKGYKTLEEKHEEISKFKSITNK